MRIYTRGGDDGTTGLLHGGRVDKDDPIATAVGDVDEAQAALGLARTQMEAGSEFDAILVELERDLYVVMAELATAVGNRHRLVPGKSVVTSQMVEALETVIETLSERFEPLKEFVLPGQTPTAAALDMARTVVRRAERGAVSARRGDPSGHDGSQVVPYLNRLSSLLWAMARASEGRPLTARRSEI